MTSININGRSVPAGTFVANPRHRQYCAERDPAVMVELILQGVGESGANPDYLFSTVSHLDALGLRDHVLHELADRVKTRLTAG